MEDQLRLAAMHLGTDNTGMCDGLQYAAPSANLQNFLKRNHL